MARETWVQSQVESYQRLKKWYLMPPCLTLSIIRYGSRVKWNNPGKGVAPSPTHWCSKLSKREPSGRPRLWSPTLLTFTATGLEEEKLNSNQHYFAVKSTLYYIMLTQRGWINTSCIVAASKIHLISPATSSTLPTMSHIKFCRFVRWDCKIHRLHICNGINTPPHTHQRVSWKWL